MRVFVLGVAVLVACVGFAADSIRAIVVPKGRLLAEKTAAQELTEYLGRMTGEKFAVVEDGAATDGPAIHLGATSFARTHIPDLDAFGKEEWAVLPRNGSLIIAGGRPRGTLYGVYHYLEDVCGVRWLTPATDHVPGAKVLPMPAKDLHGKPAMPYRSIYDIPGEGGIRFMARNRMNVTSPQYGGGKDFGGAGGAHTLYTNLGGPDEVRRLYKEHPDWFPLIDGKRFCHVARANGASQSQLCLTNPDLRRHWTECLRKRIRADRKEAERTGRDYPLYYAIDQNDCFDGFCRCPDCQAIVDREESNAGLLLDFANFVSAELEAEAPDLRFSMMALHSTEKPPKSLKARHNVTIRLCDTTSNMLHPWTHPDNARHLDNLKVWMEHADSITMWDYQVTYWAPSVVNLPTPAERTFAADIRMLRDCKGDGFFFEHENPIAADMRDLKVWMEIKLVENPDLDPDALVRDFTDAYYGPEAGALIRRYRDRLGALADDAKASVKWFPSLSDYGFIDAGFVVDCYKLRAEAIHAVRADAGRTLRVGNAFSSLDRLYLLRAASFRRQLEKRGDAVTLPDFETVAERYRLIFEGEKASRGYDANAAAENRAVAGLFDYVDKAKDLPVPEIFKDVPRDSLYLFPATFAIKYSGGIAFVPDDDTVVGTVVSANMSMVLKNEQKGYAFKDYRWPFLCAVWPTMKGTERCELREVPSEQPKGYHWYRVGDRFKLTAESRLMLCPGFNIPLDGVISDNSELGQEYEIWVSVKIGGPDIWKTDSISPETVFYVDQAAVIRKTRNCERQ